MPIAVQTIGSNVGSTYPMITRSKSGAIKPKPIYVVLTKGTYTSDHTTPFEAFKTPHWRKAMEVEYESLIKNNTWKLVPYNGQKLVDYKWAFRTKMAADGSVEWYKARLVAKGFQQDPRINVGETFSPVAKLANVRLILAIATSLNWKVK